MVTAQNSFDGFKSLWVTDCVTHLQSKSPAGFSSVTWVDNPYPPELGKLLHLCCVCGKSCSAAVIQALVLALGVPVLLPGAQPCGEMGVCTAGH